MFNRRRKAQPARREAGSVEAVVRQIAEDKSRRRFRPAAAGTEKPREVFQAAADEVAAVLVERGYRYAPSGPRATRRDGPTKVIFNFASSTLNVAGELVVLGVSVQVYDATLEAWRSEQAVPRRPDGLVKTMQLGDLLDPPRWLEWNLASPESRNATITDIAITVETVAVPFVDGLVDELTGAVDPARLVGRVEVPELIEYFVRAGRADEAVPLVHLGLSRYHERALNHFREKVAEHRTDGLPGYNVLAVPDALAFLVVQFDLPVDV